MVNLFNVVYNFRYKAECSQTWIPKHHNSSPAHSPQKITNRNARSISTVERLAFSYISFINNYSINSF